MICKNCSAEYDDALEACPHCASEEEQTALAQQAAEETETVQEDIQSDEEITVQTDAEENDICPVSQNTEEDTEQEDAESDGENDGQTDEAAEDEADCEAEEAAEDTVAQSAQTEPSEDTQQDSEQEAEESLSEQSQSVSPRKPAAARKKGQGTEKAPVKRVKKRLTRAERKATVTIIVLMCIVGVLAAGLSALSITTDIFEDSGSSDKMVASVGFTSQQVKELEKLLADCFSAAKKEYSYDTADTESFLERINPGDKGNIYSRINGDTEKLQTEPDPAGRFADEQGSYSYYKLSEKKVDRVLSLFGLESYRGENTEKYYYCDGYYYFDYEKSASTPVVKAKITKSRRVLDGSYYAECYFYLENGDETKKTDICNFVIEMAVQENGETVYKIKKISAKPIFGNDGKVLESQKTGEKKREVIEGYTNDGILYCRYIIEYPVINGEGIGYETVNKFFENAVSVYKLKAESADESFRQFTEAEGDTSELPFIEAVTAQVVFDDEKNISFIGRMSILTPATTLASDDENGEDQPKPVRIYEKKVEAYTIDKSSGNFVSKDSVLGKNYTLLGEVLYRICDGYDYKSLIEETEESYYDETPEDTDKKGAKIYESPWVYTEQGITFYYVTNEGYIKEVTVPLSVVEAINKKAQ